MIENPKILSQDQVKFLTLFAEQKELSNEFYLTGGTALAEFYIPYRYSEDLDFFSESEVNTTEILVLLKTIQSKLNYKTFDLNTSFNRNIVILSFETYDLKLEFTYFPFSRIDDSKKAGELQIDSIKDIATNKLFTIYQNPRSRDFMDLYMINKKYNFTVDELIKLAKVKFDWHVDPLQLGSQFLNATELKDYPRLIEELDEKDWQGYFLDAAKLLEKDILRG